MEALETLKNQLSLKKIALEKPYSRNYKYVLENEIKSLEFAIEIVEVSKNAYIENCYRCYHYDINYGFCFSSKTGHTFVNRNFKCVCFKKKNASLKNLV